MDTDVDVLKERMRSSLSLLAPRQQIAFGACCCDRMFPYYHALSQYLGLRNDTWLRGTIDRVWSHVSGRQISDDEAGSLQETCETLPLGEEGCCVFRNPCLEVVGGVWHTLEGCKGETTNNIVVAGMGPINIIHGEVMALIWELYDRAIGPDDYDSVNKQVYGHPAMIAELRKQANQLDFIEQHPQMTEDDIRHLRLTTIR